jgi:hypothetical protein
MGNALRERGWYANEAGTRYIRDKTKKKPAKEKQELPSVALEPLLKGEAEGDLDLAILIAVRNVIRVPDAYTNRHRAENRQSQVTEPVGGTASRWNIFGALEYVTFPGYNAKQRRKIIEQIKKALPAGQPSLMHWEEISKHSAVLALMNRAIYQRKLLLGYGYKK